VKHLTIVAALAAALVLPGVARAGNIGGYVKWSNGSACSGCIVHIHNNATGANGSTTTYSTGAWLASGATPRTTYTVSAQTAYCCHYSSSLQWTTDSNGNALFPNLIVY
jgi:hypothetical protein